MDARTLTAVIAVAALVSCAGDDGNGGSLLVQRTVSGLDARPVNRNCVAPERDTTVTTVESRPAFPGLRFPDAVALLQAPGDGSRWFVAERGGRVRVFPNDELSTAAVDFLDLGARIRESGGGALLGLAFHPGFGTNGLVYVSYTRKPGAQLQAITSEFSSPDGGLTLDPGSERVLLSLGVTGPGLASGRLAFGPDGLLYLGFGAGADADVGSGEPRSLSGKILRIDVDRGAHGAPYAIPSDNPYGDNAPCTAGAAADGACPEIYAFGFRGMRQWAIDRQSRTLWVADAGDDSSGAIYHVERGGNYRAATPVARYSRSRDAWDAGSVVYRGSGPLPLSGRFLVVDSSERPVRTLARDRSGRFSLEAAAVADESAHSGPVPAPLAVVGESADGGLLAIERDHGAIRRLDLSVAGGGDNMPEMLSETGCLNTEAPGAPPLLDLIPYGLNAAFWSDGAHKDRWLGLPEGEVISVLDSGDWDLPSGTVIVKHFRLGTRLAETRLFVRHPDGAWAGYTYRWNDAQTDATRVRGGLVVAIEGQDWTFPSEDDCMFCHNDAPGFSLGLETAQLNRAYGYPQTGRIRNQIATLNAIHVLSPPVASGAPAYADPFDPNRTLEERARSYLHTNCSFCHRPGGPTPALMDLRHDTPLTATNACNVPPTLGDLGIPDARIIAPGEPDRSELLARMSRRDFNGMPPIASRLPDLEGVALMRTWIESLEPASCR